MNIVVIGSAKHGLAFVGPFENEAAALAYVVSWKAVNLQSPAPIGAVTLTAPTDLTAGRGLK